VIVDREQFAQAVTQVVQNACEAMDRGGEIHVIVKRQPRVESPGWVVEIRDNGPGIAPHLVARVFEPFFTTSAHQLGLGLSNARRIMRLHEGEAALSSTPGRGTVVTLRLPGRDG
jgi:signal transduction histidine kinase